MMIHLKYTIKLHSDAEPATGIGSELVNNLIPRNESGQPLLPSSHLKGLMRDRLNTLITPLKNCYPILQGLNDKVFGLPGLNGNDGIAAAIRINDARYIPNSSSNFSDSHTIARTALNEFGTADEGSLRVSEIIAVGTCFEGDLLIDASRNSEIDLAARLSLMAIVSVGGGRTRGCGACEITIINESRTPSLLLKELVQIKQSTKQNAASQGEVDVAISENEKAVLLQLTFEANGPICCPVTPSVQGNNLIQSGFAIPASAVQGAILTRLNQVAPALATACFNASEFRAWPLLPMSEITIDPFGKTQESNMEKDVLPVWVSTSHRISKLPNINDKYEFKDCVIEPYEWRKVAAGSPLKGADGVLLKSDKEVKLWKSADMPRRITSHGVHYDPQGQGERNLYTIEAMAPLVYRGIIALPSKAADILLKILKDDPQIALGKARSVRGGGRLTATNIEVASLLKCQLPKEKKQRFFIVQSPIAIPDEWPIKEAGAIEAGTLFKKIIEENGWGEVEKAHATIQVLFGWNRHGHGNRVGQHHRLKARRVIASGSVFELKEPFATDDDLINKLIKGIGQGREQGLGAVLPHPGIAACKYSSAPTEVKLKSHNTAGEKGLALWEKSGVSGPSPSQIATVIDKLKQDRQAALEFVKEIQNRPPKVWFKWKPVIEEVKILIKDKDLQIAIDAMRLWQDLTINNRKDG